MSRLQKTARQRRSRRGPAGAATAAVIAVAMLASACSQMALPNLPFLPQPPAATDQPPATRAVEVTEIETEAEEVVAAPTPAYTPVDGEIVCTWWHNATVEPLHGFWSDVAHEFEAEHPGVRVNVQAFQNEELRRTILPNALAGGNAPDLFQSWGGGELVEWVREGYVMDLTYLVPAAISAIGPTVEGWQVNGRTYGLPYTFGPSGFWYNRNVLEAAGIDLSEWTPPDTLDDLYALWARLREAEVVPVALGGGDIWPSAHWWYWTALRTVPSEQIALATMDHNFEDPNWKVAGDYLAKIVDHDPFNEGWETTSAQQFLGSSAGQVVNGDAAMELMGAWAPNTMAGIWADQQGQDQAVPPNWLGWFPFPAIPSGDGDQTALLGGGDGFSVSSHAPSECVQLLDYILSREVQTRYAAFGLPTLPAAKNAVTYQPLRDAAAALHDADHVQLWLDVAFGQDVGLAMNTRISQFMQGHGTAQDIVDQMREAAGTMPEPEPTE